MWLGSHVSPLWSASHPSPDKNINESTILQIIMQAYEFSRMESCTLFQHMAASPWYCILQESSRFCSRARNMPNLYHLAETLFTRRNSCSCPSSSFHLRRLREGRRRAIKGGIRVERKEEGRGWRKGRYRGERRKERLS